MIEFCCQAYLRASVWMLAVRMVIDWLRGLGERGEMYRAFLVRVCDRQEPAAVLGGAIRGLVKRECGRVRVEYFQAHSDLELPEWVEQQLKIRRAPCVDGSIGEREIRVVGVVDEG